MALGRKSWSDAGSEWAVVSNSLIAIARLNDVEPLAWLANIQAASQTAGSIASTTCAFLAPHPTSDVGDRRPYREASHG